MKAKYDKSEVSEATTTERFPVFGVDIESRRERQKKFVQEQQAPVADKHSQAQQKLIEDKLEEAEMLKRGKEG